MAKVYTEVAGRKLGWVGCGVFLDQLQQSKNAGPTCGAGGAAVGNPVNALYPNKYQVEEDFGGAFAIRFARTYNSMHVQSAISPWTHTFTRQFLGIDPQSPYVSLLLSDGKVYTYSKNTSGVWTTNADVVDKLSETIDASGVRVGWKLVRADDSVESLDLLGRLRSIVTRNGATQTLSYDADGRLSTVSDSFGRTLSFSYYSAAAAVGANKIESITDNNANIVRYTYTSDGSFKSVSYPGGAVRTYLYNEPTFTANANRPGALTGIVDENGSRYSTFSYNASGWPVSTERGGGVEKYTVGYGSSSSTITDPLGTQRTYSFQSVLGVSRNTGVSQPCASCGANNGQFATYDSNGNLTSRTDFRNTKTCYTYDLTRNLETARIEGLPGNADCAASFTAATLAAPARKITTTWHPTYRLPATITEPTSAGAKTTTNTYDTSGNLIQRVVAIGANSRTWTWTYETLGRIKTATDSRNKTTTYTYYPNEASQNTAQGSNRGMLETIANAAGHVTRFENYNAHGQARKITDANGLVTTLVYDARMRLTSRTVGTETTGYQYDGVGQLIKVTMPDTSFMTYTYDDAHRLTKITDSQGNSITYTLDNMGNRVGEEARDPANALARKRTREIDALNRLKFDQGGLHTTATPQQTEFGYDANGNQTSLKDPIANTTTSNYDALNRLIAVIDPVNGATKPTKYDYDAQDNLTKVTDAKGLATTYSYNGFNELETQVSPDTGTTTFSYDAAGNLATKTDARNIKATYGYDDLNRVTSVSYATTAAPNTVIESVSYAYDTCANGKGRLCTITDKTGVTAYGYDLNGRITAKAQTLAGLTQTVRYRYNAAGQMDQMTTPSGQVVGYGYANNRIVSISVNGTVIANNIDYEPFGPVSEWTWGNSAANKHLRTFDLDGRIEAIQAASVNAVTTAGAAYIPVHKLGYDAASRIMAQWKLNAGAIDNSKSFSYSYDNLDRLTLVSPGPGNTSPGLAYSYDAIGNRTAHNIAGTATNYSYLATTHRLQSLSGGTNKVFSYDAVGNLTGDGIAAWIYGADNRPKQVTAGGATMLPIINALGQRVGKGGTANTTETRLWQMDGVTLAADTLLTADSSWSVTHTGDFNGDGKTDLVWRNTNGSTRLWLMNGGVATATVELQPAASTWTVTHTADLNADGKADILWRHNTNGSVVLWQMNGTAIAGVATLQPAATPWRVTHTADLNADGKADILWKHNDSSAFVWLMNSGAILASGALQGAGSPWSVTHTADLNGDGKADVLMKHTDGSIYAFLMNGTTITAGGFLQNAASGWSITHLADFNGDGKADILWRHTGSTGTNGDGTVVMWLMNGLTLTSSAGLVGANSGWSVTAVGDLNADGKRDISWRHTDGNAAVWLMNGTSLIAASGLGAQDSTRSFMASADDVNDKVSPTTNPHKKRDFNGDNKADLIITRTSGGITSRYMYDEAGRLLGEYDSGGALVMEHLWLNDLPIGAIKPKSGGGAELFYVHADHLGTPRAITRPSDNQLVWKWDNTEPFGNNAVNENPSGLGAFVYNLRMPGQQWDKETNTFYNYHRDYDSSLGRYVQSDPIGLVGGINTYGYVWGSPLKFVDRMGLDPIEGGDGWGRPRPQGPFDVLIPGTNANNQFVEGVRRGIKKIKDTCDEVSQKICEQACEITYNAWISSCQSMGNPVEIIRCAREANAWYPTCLARCKKQ